MKTHLISEPIYQSNVLLMWDCLEEQAADCFVSSYKNGGYSGEDYARDVAVNCPLHQKDPEPPLIDCACAYTPTNGFFFGIWVSPQKINGFADIAALIAHECDHIATALLTSIGIPHDAGNDEPHAYFVGYLVRNVIEALGEGFLLHKIDLADSQI